MSELSRPQHEERNAARSDSTSGPADGSPEHVVAIINPVSGAGMDPRVAARRSELLRSELARRNRRADIHVTERQGHARELAASAAASGATLVIAWGGDGTINEVGGALVRTATTLAIVPAGSGNGLAAALGVPRDAAAALAIALGPEATMVDAGLMGGRVFFNIAGIGLDARIAHLFNQRARGSRGRWPYVAIGLREGCRYRGVQYRTLLGEEPHSGRALLIAFANGHEYGMGAQLAPAARPDDGLLDAVIVGDRNIVARFWHARHLALGSVDTAPNVICRRIRTAVVESDGALEFHVDGEPGTADGRLEVSVIPAALRIKAVRAARLLHLPDRQPGEP